MRQLLQDLTHGKTQLVESPKPAVKPGHLLIKTRTSLVSAGTERMLVEFGQASLFEKARQQPDKVSQVISKMKTDGIVSTFQSVKNKLSEPLALGYCNVGTVLEVGEGVSSFRVGQRVLSNGPHSEFVVIPKNLCALVPDNVEDAHAAFTVLGAIALQGIRLAKIEVGECVSVFGLGLIGLLTVQLLKAQGCRVIGFDLCEDRIALAKEFGAEAFNLSGSKDPVAVAMGFSRGRGVDAALITASTKSNEPVSLAAKMSRKRGRIVLVGVTGLKLSRDDFFKKELSFQVSCSYGPGRYDPHYEEGGHDYPLAYVRFTEQRNFEAILDLLSSQAVVVDRLITHQIKFSEAEKAYEQLMQDKSSLGILLRYDNEANEFTTLRLHEKVESQKSIAVAFVGAGNYARSVLLPAFNKANVAMQILCARTSTLLNSLGERFGFHQISTDVDLVIRSENTNAVVIATRHDSHAELVIKALSAGKHVFVEKPLAINQSQLDQIQTVYENVRGSQILMVGFNRRFSPYIQKMKFLLNGLGYSPKAITMTINSGDIDRDHWTQSLSIGGGRVIGEMCHFVDLARYIAASPIVDVKATALPGLCDTVSAVIRFEDGSIANINYFSNGNKRVPKERVEVYCASRILVIDNYRSLKTFGFSRADKLKSFKQDKGQAVCVQAFAKAVESGGAVPIPFDELVEVTQATFAIDRQCREL